MTALGENGRTGYLLGGTAAVRSRSPKAASLLTASGHSTVLQFVIDWGSWKFFEISGWRLSPNCGCF